MIRCLPLFALVLALTACKPKATASTSQIKEIDSSSTCSGPTTSAVPPPQGEGTQFPGPAKTGPYQELGTSQPDDQAMTFQDASTFQSGSQADMRVVSSFEQEPAAATTEQANGQTEFGLTDGGCTPAAKKALSPAEEEQLIRDAYDFATKEVKKGQPGLGRGWTGNVTGCGPKCNVVHDAYQPFVNSYLKEKLVGQQLNHYTPVTVFDSGSLPYDLGAHVYMGIGTKPKTFSEKPVLKSWVDPWRYGNTTQYLPGTGPNSPDQIIDSH